MFDKKKVKKNIERNDDISKLFIEYSECEICYL